MHPETNQLKLAILSARLRQTDEAMAAKTFLTMKARVARALLGLAQYFGLPSNAGAIVFQERITQADIAAMAGIARENVSRILTRWRRRQIVTGSSHRYRLNYVAALNAKLIPATLARTEVVV